MTRFVVTGSGRCGTHYMSQLLTAAGVPCGHEHVFKPNRREQGGVATTWPDGVQADSSWMAACVLPLVQIPVVLLVRHPLLVVSSFVQIGFFSHDLKNPTHGPLRHFAPEVYDFELPADRALAMWLKLTTEALARAELVVRLDRVDGGQLGRLLQWAGADPEPASTAFRRVQRSNLHEVSKRRFRIRHELSWDVHDKGLAGDAMRLAWALGYDLDEVPDA